MSNGELMQGGINGNYVSFQFVPLGRSWVRARGKYDYDKRRDEWNDLE